jgi:hypothetical protein
MGTWGSVWNWIKDKLLGPVIAAASLAVLAFIVGLLALSGKVERLEKQTERLPEIDRTLGGLVSNLTNYKNASDGAVANVNRFNTELLALGKANGELKGHVDDLVIGGGKVRDVRTRLNAVFPLPGVSSMTVFAEPHAAGYSLLLTTNQPDAVAQFLTKQPIPVEVIYIVDR